MTDWSELKEKVLMNCVKHLDSLGVKYAIIRTNGEKIGSLSVEEPQEKKRGPNKYGRNELKNHIRPTLEAMKVGDEAVVPCYMYEPKAVQSSVTSIACNLWGKGTYVSALSKDKTSVSILRVS